MTLEAPKSQIEDVLPTDTTVSWVVKPETTPSAHQTLPEKPSPEQYAQDRNNLILFSERVSNLENADQVSGLLELASEPITTMIMARGKQVGSTETIYYGGGQDGYDGRIGQGGYRSPRHSLGGSAGEHFEATIVPDAGVITIKLSNAGLSSTGRPIDGIELTIPIKQGDGKPNETPASILHLNAQGQVDSFLNLKLLEEGSADMLYFKECVGIALEAVAANTPPTIE